MTTRRSQPLQEELVVEENKKVGPSLYLMQLSSSHIAHMILPGQFVHLKVPGLEGHILRRPFSVYASRSHSARCEGREGSSDTAVSSFSVLYQVVGSGTEHMTNLAVDTKLDAIGPIGNPWNPPVQAQRALLVGGGVGAAPLFMLAETLSARGCQVDVVLGSQTEAALVCREDFSGLLKMHKANDSHLSCATDDGSFGHKGFCTELAGQALESYQYDYMAVCGPEPMAKIAVKLAGEKHVRCEVSLERRMACGIGACLSCVVQTCDGLKRACVDGPVFDAAKVVFV